jgi:hypothetical protein
LYLTKYIYIYISQWHNQNVIRSQNIKTSLKGFFCLIIKVFFFLLLSSQLMFDCVISYIKKIIRKKVGARAIHSKVRGWHQHTSDNACEASQRPKNTLSSCWWKRRHVLFLLVWHYRRRWLGFSLVSLFFFSLSSPENHSLTLFVVVISTSVFILLIFNFCS